MLNFTLILRVTIIAETFIQFDCVNNAANREALERRQFNRKQQWADHNLIALALAGASRSVSGHANKHAFAIYALNQHQVISTYIVYNSQ